MSGVHAIVLEFRIRETFQIHSSPLSEPVGSANTNRRASFLKEKKLAAAQAPTTRAVPLPTQSNAATVPSTLASAGPSRRFTLAEACEPATRQPSQNRVAGSHRAWLLDVVTARCSSRHAALAVADCSLIMQAKCDGREVPLRQLLRNTSARKHVEKSLREKSRLVASESHGRSEWRYHVEHY